MFRNHPILKETLAALAVLGLGLVLGFWANLAHARQPQQQEVLPAQVQELPSWGHLAEQYGHDPFWATLFRKLDEDKTTFDQRLSAVETGLAEAPREAVECCSKPIIIWLGWWWWIGWWGGWIWFAIWVFVGWQWWRLRIWRFIFWRPWWFWIPLFWFIPWVGIGIWRWGVVFVPWIWWWWLFPWIFWVPWWIIVFKHWILWCYRSKKP